MNRRLIDTNVIVRLLVLDNRTQAERARQLSLAAGRGEVTLVVLDAVVAEAVFVLESIYKNSREEVAAKLIDALKAPGVELAHPTVTLDALERYAATNLDFVDCLLGAASVAQGIPVATFDADFKKFKDVTTRLE